MWLKYDFQSLIEGTSCRRSHPSGRLCLEAIKEQRCYLKRTLAETRDSPGSD